MVARAAIWNVEDEVAALVTAIDCTLTVVGGGEGDAGLPFVFEHAAINVAAARARQADRPARFMKQPPCSIAPSPQPHLGSRAVEPTALFLEQSRCRQPGCAVGLDLLS
jgi:hypothetical protein